MDFADMVRGAESLKKIKEIIKAKGLPIDFRWIDYEALNTAIICQRKDVAKYLIEQNCRVNKVVQPSGGANTPLHNAVLLGDIELVSELLKKGALVHKTNASGNTPLHLAFIDKHNDIVDLILTSIQENSNSSNLKNNQGLSHLHIACATNNSVVVQNYIAAGANLQHAVNNDSLVWAGYTVLHFAAEFKSHGAVKILLKAGANPDIKNANQHTPLQLVNEGLIDLAMTADALSVKVDPYNREPCVEHMSYFHMACLRNDPISVKKFIVKGAEINAPISDSSEFYAECTPLHFAAMTNEHENIKLLLKNGADVSRADYKSMTPLHYALYSKNKLAKSKTIDLLHEANVYELEDFDDENGLSYFHVAIIRNKLDLVKEFLDDDQDVNWPLAEHAPEFPAYYPLHFAARYQHVKMAALLLKRGAYVNKVSWDGSALHIAFELGNHDLIKLFWNNGADVRLLRPKDKKTMLHLLVETYVNQKEENNSKADVLLGYIKKLVQRGVDIDAQTEILNEDDSDTALHFACYRLHLGSPCVKLLLDCGADINLENTHDSLAIPSCLPIFGFKYHNNAADFMMLYHHVQKLKALGCKVDSRNEKYCKDLMDMRDRWDIRRDKNAEEFKDETIKRLEQERLDEIKTLKSVKLIRTMTLHDFLLLDAKTVVAFANNKVLKKIVESKNLERDYTSYGYLIRLQYERAVSGAKAEGSMKREINNSTPNNSSKRPRRG